MRLWAYAALLLFVLSALFFTMPVRGAVRESATEIIECGLDYERFTECMGKAVRGREGAEELKAVIAELAENETVAAFRPWSGR